MGHQVDRLDCVVAGAGVIGLAIARRLALSGLEVLVIERADRIGMGISARNSEVIHSGLYYPPDSLKARFCVEGRGRLYTYCAERGIGHAKVGKLIAAVGPAQIDRLDGIRDNAGRCGVTDLEMLTRQAAQALEPELECSAALLSPSTGIIDAQSYMLALHGDAEEAGAVVAFRTTVERVVIDRDEILVNTRETDGDEFTLSARIFINATGLDAPSLAAGIEGFPTDRVPRQWLARGCYFRPAGRSPFQRLIYPVPVDGGLGVHLTLDLAGQARFGPDVEWIDEVDFTVDPARGKLFREAILTYWPGLADRELHPDYAGVRPKLSGPGQPAADFLIQGPADHGAGNIINLFGIESPGLTSSLAIADHVGELVIGLPMRR
jgi:L-2-hydroxyglutarate oxidase LhgO